jgi:hypothetical protein
MTQIERLIDNYRRFVANPWQANVADRQRVWFAVYPPSEERRLRTQLQQFEIDTQAAQHGWHLVDITHTPARWLANHEYREGYFETPDALSSVEEELRSLVADEISAVLRAPNADAQSVVAVLGAGSLFGLTSVSAVAAKLEGNIRGRLLVFFPGVHQGGVYRFMDARNGFNYMAVPIDCSERMGL